MPCGKVESGLNPGLLYLQFCDRILDLSHLRTSHKDGEAGEQKA